MTTPKFRYALSPCLFVVLAGFASGLARAEDHAIDFHRDVRPLLSDACFHCHGPDEATQEAGLRLDVEDAAKEYAIVEGDPDASEVMQTETKTLLDMLDKQRARISTGQLEAEAIAGGGSSDEQAAWTLLARVLLNLDETITKE